MTTKEPLRDDTLPATDLDTIARRNLFILFTVSVFIGLGVAIYEVALPLYLKKRGFTWREMGWIYAVSVFVACVIRIGLGAWSDRAGRKIVYVLSLVGSSLATTLTPFGAKLYVQMLLRSITEPAIRAREVMHSILIYEDSPDRFLKSYSKTRGIEFLFHFLGLLGAAAFFAWLVGRGVSRPQESVLIAAAVLLLISGVIFALFFHEKPLRTFGRRTFTWRDIFHPRLTRPMWVMTISIFVFNATIGISHSFALQLFFKEKYHAADSDIFIIGALHRLSSAVPLLLLGHIFKHRQKFWLMFFLIVEGFFLIAPALMPARGPIVFGAFQLRWLWVVVFAWLFHDILGMGLWLPMQQAILQRHSNSDTRGTDISVAGALAALGSAFGPLIAGWLRETPLLDSGLALNLTFVVSGIGAAASAVILFWLKDDE